MLTKDIEFTLRDGRKAVLRNPQERDIQGVLDYLYLSAGETEFILRYPEECSKYTYEGEKALFEKWNASENELSLVCDVDGRIVGNCQISFTDKIKTAHKARIGIALIREFWGLGIGTEMMKAMISAARAKEGVLQIELECVEGNARARALYEKMGFRIAAVKPDSIRLKDGTLLNEFFMIKRLER